MKLQQMKDRMVTIVKEVSKKYSGGESYFTELDNQVKCDEQLMISFIDYIVWEKNADIVASGGFGGKLLKHQEQLKFREKFLLVVLNGGLRKGNKVNVEAIVGETDNKRNLFFVDDSFFSGATLDAVAKQLNKMSLELSGVYVMYDGSKVKSPIVESLYRYWDNVGGQYNEK